MRENFVVNLLTTRVEFIHWTEIYDAIVIALFDSFIVLAVKPVTPTVRWLNQETKGLAQSESWQCKLTPEG